MISEPQFNADAWAPKQGPLMTRWAKNVRPDRAHAEYPRPTMVRKDWMNLNGLWDLEIKAMHPETPDRQGSAGFKGKILVPYPVESALSGVMKPIGPTDKVEYRRTFQVPTRWKTKRLLIHFGAVDWACEVFVNGTPVGDHTGGYDGFSLDITDALRATGPQELRVVAYDATDAHTQPRGKQVLKPEGIWYTPTSGIWQTVWLEPVPKRHIRSFKVRTAPQSAQVHLAIDANLKEGDKYFIRVTDGSETAVDFEAQETEPVISFKVRNMKWWSPENPFLYKLQFGIKDASGNVIDTVDSYFAFREFKLDKDSKGRTKFFLNGKPYFIVGPLDQGFWPDGLYTPPTEAAMKYDLDVTKKFGFNMIRKHVKVESERWYYLCDKMGILVFQDMPSGDAYIGGPDPDITRTKDSADQFLAELEALVKGRYNHPSIVAWVPFNEGWGQWKTSEVTDFVRKLDSTRLIDNPSGWTDRGVGDMHDIHAYPGPASPKPEANRAAFLGEFGGLGLPMPGHMWKKEGWGYRSFKTKQELTDGLAGLLGQLRFLIHEPGLSGAVYTQTTDVEVEINGLMTYDREVIKFDVPRIRKAVEALFKGEPEIREVVPTSETTPVEWSYTTTTPLSADWMRPGGLGWKIGPAGFGTDGTPGAVVRTNWNTSDIWMRREFLLPKIALSNPHLRIHHDEDVEVYLDGQLLVKRSGYTTGYVLVPLDKIAAKRLIPGRHSLAVHCKQTGGGQYIDVGIVDVAERAMR